MQKSSPCLPLVAGACALAIASLTLTASAAIGAPAPKRSAESDATTVPGGLIRWSEPGARSCRIGGRSWQPLNETCYFPIDLLQKPGIVTVTLVGARTSQSAHVRVDEHDYGTQEVELPDIPQNNPSRADQARVVREGKLIARAMHRREGPAQFTLPLGSPAKPMPPGKAFGVNRVFNGKPAGQPHMGIDYAVGPGVPVLAVADGTVVLAQDLFHPGNAVFVDHGDGLSSESFHLSEIAVKNGDVVKKGDMLGKVGSTGRSTGPHLFFGIRWHGARINPKPLFEDPLKIPAVRKGK
jgi:murein DD-endopeptidase MepM/ murein hydrolase activator NlpD